MELLVTVVNKSDQKAQEIHCRLETRLVVGRGTECDVPIEGPAISREHLIVEQGDADSLLITDVSANGCWVNGARLPKSRRVPLRETDALEVPGFEVRIRPFTQAPVPPPVEGVRQALAEPRRARSGSLLAPVSAFLGSFTGREKFAAGAALLSLGLVLVYALS